VRHPAAVFLGALLIGALPAAAQKFEVPALVVPPSAEHHVGKVIWTDLATPDLAAAEKFYSGLFGWTFRELRAGDKGYALALLDGRPVAGLFQRPEPPGERKRPAWLGYISVRDADAAKTAALAHGAKVVFEPKTYAQRGRQAVFSDPEGAVFGSSPRRAATRATISRPPGTGSGARFSRGTRTRRRPSTRRCSDTTSSTCRRTTAFNTWSSRATTTPARA